MRLVKKVVGKTVFFLIIVILLSFSAFAMSVSPPKYVFDYGGSFTEEINFRVKSNSPYPAIIGVNFSEGELAKYLTILDNDFRMEPAGSKNVRIKIDVPENHGLVGKQAVWVKIKEKEALREDSGIVVTTAAAPAIVVNFPYPGTYLEINNVGIESINEEENSTLERKIISRGEQSTYFTSHLEILNQSGVVVIEKDYPSTFIKGLDTFEDEEPIRTDNLIAGVYTVDYTLYYEDEEKTTKSFFQVGEESVDLLDYNPKKLKKGEISEMKFEVVNKWNGNFNNVYGLVKFENVSIETPSVNLQPFGKEKLKQYVDFRSYDVGNYTGSIEIFFQGTKKTFPLKISIIETKEVKESEPINTSIIILYVGIGVLAIILLILIFIILKTKNKQK